MPASLALLPRRLLVVTRTLTIGERSGNDSVTGTVPGKTGVESGHGSSRSKASSRSSTIHVRRSARGDKTTTVVGRK